eukprot:5311579-Amphidinium_carterae.1
MTSTVWGLEFGERGGRFWRLPGGHGLVFRFMAALLALGSFASAIPWLIGPVRGLAQLVGARDEWQCVLAQNALCAAVGWCLAHKYDDAKHCR